MRRVVFNQKGGVGKSSIAVNLAAIDAYQGHRTLLIDLDPQCNASQYLLGADFEGMTCTVADFFREFIHFRIGSPTPPMGYVSATAYDNLFVMAGSAELTELQAKLEARFKMYKLRDAVEALEAELDVIYIDTPPAFNFYALSALIATRRCLVPFDCDDFSRRALYSLLENVEETRSDHNRELQVEGIVVNQYASRANLPVRMVEALRQEGLPVLQSMLSSSVKMRESHERSIPLIHYAPNHKLTQEYLRLFEELHDKRPTEAGVARDSPSGRTQASVS